MSVQNQIIFSISDFTASNTWADGIRVEFEGHGSGSNHRSGVFNKSIEWTKQKLDTDGRVYLDDFKKKYTDLNGGKPSKKWTNLNKRVKDRLSLTSKFTKETRIGKRSKTCIVYKWFWEKK